MPEPAARVLASDHAPDSRVNLISNISAADRLPAVPELAGAKALLDHDGLQPLPRELGGRHERSDPGPHHPGA